MEGVSAGPIGREGKGTPRRGVPAENEAVPGGGAPCVIMSVWTSEQFGLSLVCGRVESLLCEEFLGVETVLFMVHG